MVGIDVYLENPKNLAIVSPKQLMNTLKEIAINILDFIPFTYYQSLLRIPILGLLYHVISDRPLKHIMHLYSYKSSKSFEADLVYLMKYFNFISYEELLLSRNSLNRKYIKKPAILTFDDGYAECFSIVRPILLKYKIPCIFFLTTDFINNKKMFYRNKISLCIDKIKSCSEDNLIEIINSLNKDFKQNVQDDKSFILWLKSLDSNCDAMLDEVCALLGLDIKHILLFNKPYLSFDEIRTLELDGFTIGAHTKMHPRLSSLSEENLKREVIDSCEEIWGITQQKRVPFSFPFGTAYSDFKFLKSFISQYDFIGLLFDSSGLTKYDEMIINRIGCDSSVPGGAEMSNMSKLLKTAYCSLLFKNHLRILSNLATDSGLK